MVRCTPAQAKYRKRFAEAAHAGRGVSDIKERHALIRKSKKPMTFDEVTARLLEQLR